MILKDRKPVVRRGCGYADLAHHVSATNDRLASESKQFTATAILRLTGWTLAAQSLHNPFAACATARNSARPLFIVSSHSVAGSES